IQVKLIHSWRQKTNSGGDTLELIFADEFVRYIYIYFGQSMACCLWGKYAEQLEEHLQKSNYPNMVCLIRFAKIGFYKGDVKVTNAFDASLIQFNPEFPETLALKLSHYTFLFNLLVLLYFSYEYALALTDTKKEKHLTKDHTVHWNNVKIKSISEIMMAPVEEGCKIICLIECMDTYWSWFYFGHNSCKSKALILKSKEGGILFSNEKPLFWCTSCHATVTSVAPKYKLHMFVKDDTSTCKLMMLDSVRKLIVGCEAEELWDGSYDEIEDPTYLPQPIRDLVVCSGDKILQIESNSDPMTHVMDGSSITSGGEVYVSEKNSQNSSEGTSTPFSKHKEKDQLDQNSTSKKICSKSVKMEKIKDD
ncbi:unnamed protein product, partial [Brassica rapa subsp. narinosa]